MLQRPVTQPNEQREVYRIVFLDEATALSAGHRPCKYCTRRQLDRFKQYGKLGNGCPDFSLGQIDDCLYEERLGPTSPSFRCRPSPAVLMVSKDCVTYLLTEKGLRAWSFSEYGTTLPLKAAESLTLLIPVSLMKTIRAGYSFLA